MRVLDELGHEIERIAAEAGDVRGRRRWWRSTAALVVLPLTIGTVAVAATTQLLQGEPVRNPPDLKLNPKAGLGVIVGPGKMLDVQTPDPAGGPPWGLRMVKTSRGFGCVQIGRVNEGKLGVLGQDGAFGDDGKFHERGAEIIQQTDCQTVDGAGTTFIALVYSGLPASADQTGCSPGGNGQLAPCPEGSLRTVYYGLLGPEATAVTYLDANGQLARQAVNGPEGAYLVVKPTPPGQRNAGQWTSMESPGSGLKSVEYRDGSVCNIPDPRRIGGAKKCPLKGLVPLKVERATRADLATPVRAEVGSGRVYLGPDRKYPQRRITLRFRARVEATTTSFYTVRMEGKRRGRGCSMMGFMPIARDVKAGTVVTQRLHVPYGCRGKLKISVGYTQQRKPSGHPYDTNGWPNDKVGTVTAEIR